MGEEGEEDNGERKIGEDIARDCHHVSLLSLLLLFSVVAGSSELTRAVAVVQWWLAVLWWWLVGGGGLCWWACRVIAPTSAGLVAGPDWEINTFHCQHSL